jgi:hypothetical protein
MKMTLRPAIFCPPAANADSSISAGTAGRKVPALNIRKKITRRSFQIELPSPVRWRCERLIFLMPNRLGKEFA